MTKTYFFAAVLSCIVVSLLGACVSNLERSVEEKIHTSFFSQGAEGRSTAAQIDLQLADKIPFAEALRYLQEINLHHKIDVTERNLCRDINLSGITHKTFMSDKLGPLSVLIHDTHSAFSQLSLEAAFFTAEKLIEISFHKKNSNDALPCVIWQETLPQDAQEPSDEQRAIINKIATAAHSLGIEVLDLF